MEGNIVHSVARIEEEADRIAAEAKERAAGLAGSLPAEIEQVRARSEQELQRRVASLKERLHRETERELEHVRQEAAKARVRLDSLDKAAMEHAADGIVARLREAGAWR